MTDLDKKKCVPCEGGLDPLSKNEAEKLLSKLDSGGNLVMILNLLKKYILARII